MNRSGFNFSELLFSIHCKKFNRFFLLSRNLFTINLFKKQCSWLVWATLSFLPGQATLHRSFCLANSLSIALKVPFPNKILTAFMRIFPPFEFAKRKGLWRVPSLVEMPRKRFGRLTSNKVFSQLSTFIVKNLLTTKQPMRARVRFNLTSAMTGLLWTGRENSFSRHVFDLHTLKMSVSFSLLLFDLQ